MFSVSACRYIAAHDGRASCVQLLLQAKANPRIAVRGGISPLYIAVQKNHAEITQQLLDAGADPCQQLETPPLAVAVFHCNSAIVQQLTAAGAMVDAEGGNNGNTVAMLAAYSLDVDILSQLVLHGASLNICNAQGLTVDNVLRKTHGLRVYTLAFYCLGQHRELQTLSGGDSDDAESIRQLFADIDADGDEVGRLVGRLVGWLVGW